MVEHRKPMKVEQAIQKIMDCRVQGNREYASINNSLGRVLAEDIRADHDVPPFNRSPYDGYAIRSVDSKTASRDHPVVFNVIGRIGAGEVFSDTVKAKQAVKIMTGAPIPTGCDAVIMLELVEEKENQTIRIKRAVQPNDNISFRGEDVKKNTVIIEKGKTITPGVVALLATFGYEQVPVVEKPVVGIIATGSELVEIDEPLADGKIRNSNAYMIQAQLERIGVKAIYFGQFSDDLDLCFEQVSTALEQVDVLISTGGVSVGDFDFLPEIYQRLDATVLFNKVGMRPGSVTTVAVLNEKVLFGLSGNPSACYVGFELFVRPFLRSYLCDQEPFCKAVRATIGSDFLKPNPFDRFVRGTISFDDGDVVVTPVGLDKSNVVTSLALANVLIVLPGGTRGYRTGDKVVALLLDNNQGAAVYLNNYTLKEKRNE